MKNTTENKSDLIRFLLLIILFLLNIQLSNAKELYKTDNRNTYEVLGGLEKQIYNKEYTFEEFLPRIERLENSIYGSKAEGPLLKRLEKLKIAAKDHASVKKEINKQVILDLLENKFFGATYNDDNLEIRLARLENSLFGRTFTGNTEARFSNLIERVPIAVTGVSVEDNSGGRALFKPEQQYAPVLEYKYLIKIRNSPSSGKK